MQRLSDGVFAVQVRADGPWLVRHAQDLELRLELDEDAFAGATLYVEEDGPDAVLEEVWAFFGEGLADPRWSDDERAQLRALRAKAAEKKRFASLVDGALVPESALAVARRLERHAPPGARVLVTGGQALLGAALAQRGFDVVTLDDGRGEALTAPLPGELRAAFDLVATDTLPYPELEVGALCRAASALKEGGRLVAFGHSMQRPFARDLFTSAGLVVCEPLFEIAARVHAGYALEPFLWDEWVLAPRGAPPLSADAPLEAARGFDPKEKTQGNLDVVGFEAGGLSGAGMDRAVALLTESGLLSVVEQRAADEGGLLRRHLVLDGGRYLSLAARPAEGEVIVDLAPWSPALLFAAAAALRLANRAAKLGRTA